MSAADARLRALVVGAVGGAAVTLAVQALLRSRKPKPEASGSVAPPKKGPPPPGKNKRRPCAGKFLDPEYGFRYIATNGIVYPPWSEDQEECIRHLQKQDWLQAGDIVVATYPKAGTTLMQQIVMLLLNQGNPDEVGDVMVTSPWVEREYCTSQDRDLGFKEIQSMTTAAGTRRVFKTHAPFDLFPAARIPDGVKVICVVRDPRDVAVSMHKHYLGEP